MKFSTLAILLPLLCLLTACDNDNDGLSNKMEKKLGTDPNVADTDGDGVNDGDEVAAGLDPLVSNIIIPKEGDWSASNWTLVEDTCGFGADNEPVRIEIIPAQNSFQLIYHGGDTPIEMECLIEFGKYECRGDEQIVELDDGAIFSSQTTVSGTFETRYIGDVNAHVRLTLDDDSCDIRRQGSLLFVD